MVHLKTLLFHNLLWRLNELLIIPGTLVILAYLLNQRLQEREYKQNE